ncbi:MAG: MarR family transcriptional regulator [Oscillospiraceae bacterium]|nr:MarR family transcriptional regulator [Oscillospiraceae bacterium]
MEYLQDTFVYHLLTAQKKLVAAVKQDFTDSGITHENYITLHFIFENPGLTQVELAERNDKDRNVIVKTIDRLEAAGLVRRVRGMRDRRSFCLFITEEGEAVVREYWARLVQRQEECLTALSVEEKKTLMALLMKVNDEGER